ncbi:MAG: glycosyltransferase [Elusimicrobia bacterium]|nr:glycosyltransferase [Elusimicrobiota bacterium]
MKILLVPDPESPYGEDAFCRELAGRAASRGHETLLSNGASSPETDVVLINSFQPAAIRAAREASRRVAVRLIDSFAEVPAADLPPLLEALRQADRILVPSRYLAELAQSWGAAEKARLVPYAYDRVMANQIALVTMRASRPADFQIVTTCRFSEACRPGLEMLMSAAGRLRFEWHLTIMGEGPILPSIQERARRLLPTGRVLFPGPLPHLKIMEFFRSAKVYVNPNGGEGFPAMSLYALSEGCPVVAPRCGAVPELIMDGKNGMLFNAGDAASLSGALTTLWSVRGLSLQLIAEGVKTVERHTWDATVAAAFGALEELTP